MGTLAHDKSDALRSISRFIDQLLELELVRVTSRQALSELNESSNLVQALRDVPTEPKERRERIQRILLEVAQAERTRDFPILNATSLIAMWAAFEAMIEDMLIEFLLKDPTLLSMDCFSKIKLPLAKFEEMDQEERMRFLLSECEKQSPRARSGIDRIESLLEPFGLSGAVDAELRRNLLAMSNIRNVLVHRASVADRRLVTECPWLGLTIGATVRVSSGMVETFKAALERYVMTIIQRIKTNKERSQVQ